MKNKRSKEEYENAVATSLSIAEVCRKLNIKPVGGNYKTVQYAIKEFDLDTSHFTGQAWNQGLRYRQVNKPKSLELILVEKSDYPSLSLKQRLLKEGYKEHRCEHCKRTEWEGQEIPLELHHINGNKFDNRLENLRLLCPNCHTLTDNYRGKNQHRYLTKEKKVEIITNVENKSKKKRINRQTNKLICQGCGKEFIPKNKTQKYCSVECYNNIKKDTKRPDFLQFIKDIKELKNFVQISKRYEVSDNTIRKWCEHYNLPTHTKELNEYIKYIKK